MTGSKWERVMGFVGTGKGHQAGFDLICQRAAHKADEPRVFSPTKQIL